MKNIRDILYGFFMSFCVKLVLSNDLFAFFNMYIVIGNILKYWNILL